MLPAIHNPGGDFFDFLEIFDDSELLRQANLTPN